MDLQTKVEGLYAAVSDGRSTGNDCENCPEPCDRVLATMAGASATPGTQPTLLYSANGGETTSTKARFT